MLFVALVVRRSWKIEGMASVPGLKCGKRGRGECKRGGEVMPRDRVRKVLFVLGSSRARVNFATSGGFVEPGANRPSIAVAGGNSNGRESEEGVQRMRNERNYERRYTEEKFGELLKNCPDGELELLRSSSYEDLIHEAMTNVFRGGFGFLVAVQKMRAVVLASRRLRADNEELTKKFIKKGEELNAVLDEKIVLVEKNCKQDLELHEARYRSGELEAEAKDWRQSYCNMLDYVDRVNEHLREIREGEKPEYHYENYKFRTDSEGGKQLDLNVATEDVKRAN